MMETCARVVDLRDNNITTWLWQSKENFHHLKFSFKRNWLTKKG
jgi:hypothetical protein